MVSGGGVGSGVGGVVTYSVYVYAVGAVMVAAFAARRLALNEATLADDKI